MTRCWKKVLPGELYFKLILIWRWFKLLVDDISSAFAQYNKDQLTPCRVQGTEQPVVISEHNDIGNGRFYDPRIKQSFKYDHLKKEASEFQVIPKHKMF